MGSSNVHSGTTHPHDERTGFVMSVAVKTSTGTPSAGSQVKPALVSLVGVLFLLACLAIVFKLIPDLWWGFWESVAGTESKFVGGTLLLVVGIAVTVALF